VTGNYAYVANGDNGLMIVDVTFPEYPSLAGSVNTAGYSAGVAVAETMHMLLMVIMVLS